MHILFRNSWWWISIKYGIGSLELYTLMQIRPHAWNPNISQGEFMRNLWIYWVFPSHSFWDWVNSWGSYVHSLRSLRTLYEMMCYESNDLRPGYLRLLFFDHRDIYVGSLRSILFYFLLVIQEWGIMIDQVSGVCDSVYYGPTERIASPIVWPRHPGSLSLG